MPWRKKLLEASTYAEPIHFRQTASTSACGVVLTDLFIERTESMDEVTCPFCADLRTAYLSKLGHPEGNQS